MEAIAQIPAYGRFLKEMSCKKRRLVENERVPMTGNCSMVLTSSLPPKLKDQGSFSIPCTIGRTEFAKALLDLGASLSLLPLVLCRQLGLTGDALRTTISLQLADGSIKRPVGVIEDVLVKMERFYIPVDLVVVDTQDEFNATIILGRLFLRTAGGLH